MTGKKLISGIIILIAAALIIIEVVAYWPTNHSDGDLTKGGPGSPESTQSPLTPTETASGPITIYGYVYDRTTGYRIPQTTISIALITNGGLGGSIVNVRKITSDDNGSYSITLNQLLIYPDQVNGFPYQEYQLTAIHKNFMSAEKHYGHDTFEKKIDFYLEPAGLIKGVVYDDKAKPLNDSSVGIYSSDMEFIDMVRTDCKGQFQVDQIQPGTYSLIVSRMDYDNFIKPQITFRERDELKEDIYLNMTRSNITLKGKVSNTLGNEYVKLFLINDRNELTITTTDKNGNFESTLFSTGDYRVKAIQFYGSHFELSNIEKDIRIGFGENYETIDPMIAVP